MSLNGVFIPGARTAGLRPHRTGRRPEHPKSDSDLADGDGQSCSAEARSTHERGSPTRRGARIRRQDNGQVEHDQGGRHRRRRQARRTSWTDTGESRTRNEDRADTHAGRRCRRTSGVDLPKDQHDAGAREPQLDDRLAAERSTESPNRPSSTGVSQLERTAVVSSPGQRRTGSVQRTWGGSHRGRDQRRATTPTLMYGRPSRRWRAHEVDHRGRETTAAQPSKGTGADAESRSEQRRQGDRTASPEARDSSASATVTEATRTSTGQAPEVRRQERRS